MREARTILPRLVSLCVTQSMPVTLRVHCLCSYHLLTSLLLSRTDSYDETEHDAHYVSKRTATTSAGSEGAAAAPAGGAGGADAVAATRARIDKLKLSGAVREDKAHGGEGAWEGRCVGWGDGWCVKASVCVCVVGQRYVRGGAKLLEFQTQV